MYFFLTLNYVKIITKMKRSENMNDLKIIKKKYGEKMAHLCRELFPSILENDGLLAKLMLNHFSKNRSLYNDIVSNNLIGQFKNYICNLAKIKEQEEEVFKTPSELLSEAGYILYECYTEEDINKFKKYYHPEEELCTFHGGRLDKCYVFFAVKKDVDKIKRCNFINPKRQDKYGTSVISIQFTKDKNHTLSIKNRYNHSVQNPDATFSNNLDNIISGLTKSFENTYGLKQGYVNDSFEIPNYVSIRGKYYKYNYEINNIYYCTNNIIIDNFKVKKFDKEKYLIIDYFIIDLVNKTLDVYDKSLTDDFINRIGIFDKCYIKKIDNGKKINLFIDNNKVELIVNKNNVMIEYQDDLTKKITNEFLCLNEFLKKINLLKVTEIGDGFLGLNQLLENISIPLVKSIGSDFLARNHLLRSLTLPNVLEIGDKFLCFNQDINKLEIPRVIKIGDAFLFINKKLDNLNLPNIEIIGSSFLSSNDNINKIKMPSLKKVGDYFLHTNNKIESLYLPNLMYTGHDFLAFNSLLKNVYLPKLEIVGERFLYENETLKELELPSLKICGDSFLANNKILTKFISFNLEKISKNFMLENKKLKDLYIPNIKYIDDMFLEENEELEKFVALKLEYIGSSFLHKNKKLVDIKLPKVIKIGGMFLTSNNSIKNISLPNVQIIDNWFLADNNNIETLSLPNVLEIGNYFLYNCDSIKELYLPLLEKVGSDFLFKNTKLNRLYVPNLKEINTWFLCSHKNLDDFSIPNLNNFYKTLM